MYATVPKGNIRVSAAIVPGRALVPEAVRPTTLRSPLRGPDAMTGRPNQLRFHPQQRPQEQYPVVTTLTVRGGTWAGGRIPRSPKHPDRTTAANIPANAWPARLIRPFFTNADLRANRK